MAKQKSTKRALLASGLALFMCISMFVGSTFAWFTDSVKTGVNTIQAGTLDIALEYSMDNGVTWENAEGKTLSFKAADNRTDILWEPGCTYELPAIRVRNNGNLALKYQLYINGTTGDAELLKAIDFTANDAVIDIFSGELLTKDAISDKIVIKGHMKETAGNEYMGLTIEGIGITVYATQFTYEKDSEDEMYDKDATYTISVNSTNELVSSFENMTEATVFDATGISIDVDTVGTTTDEIIVPTFSIPTGATVKGVEFKFGASMISAEATAVSDTVVFDECDIVTADADDTDGMPAMALVGEMGATVSTTKYVFNNCTFKGYIMLNGINAEFNNCTFVLSNENDGATYCSFGEYVFNNCTFNYEGGTNEIATSSIYAESHATVTLKDCTLIGASYGNSADSTITVE